MRTRTKAKGFTLIELMITVAIVGILASVALPAYSNYTIRAQVSEGFVLSEGIQTAVNENYAQTGVLASSLTTLGIAAPAGKYVSSVALTGAGVVTVTFGTTANTKIQGGSITLTAKDDGNGNLHWACAPDGKKITTVYVPSSCTNI
ncbi:MAG: pilin [Bdellovibrio sp.]|nr:pilin [Bdellovibrio sp.]